MSREAGEARLLRFTGSSGNPPQHLCSARETERNDIGTVPDAGHLRAGRLRKEI